MTGYIVPAEVHSNEPPSDEGPTTLYLEQSIPVEPNGGPGGDVGPLHGNPLSHMLEDLSSWFPHGDDHGGGYPPFYAAPPASGDGPHIVPYYGEASPGPGDGLDW